MNFLSLLLIPLLLVFSYPHAWSTETEIKQFNPKAFELNATSLERKRKGYGRYPVVQCPGVKAKYLEF